ncbi:MAG: DUF3990 domain-containing protein [Bacteroidales bacterium]|nr:DUF3990 domain-containing protein [Bacteroidales bacterium]
MSAIIVFHGGTQVIDEPVCKFGRQNLDFGAGFYVTDLKEQAVSWANNMARSRKESPILNSYRMDRDAILNNYKCKVFTAYDKEWLEFIVANRQGLNEARKYDYVEGGVANDRVVDTVNLYVAGLMDISTALGELSKHQPNNQMCILNQDIINKHFTYHGTENL